MIRSNDLLLVAKLIQGLDRNTFRNHRLVMVQHLVPDVEKFIRLLERKFASVKVIGIDYSKNTEVIDSLKRDGADVTVPSFEQPQDSVKESVLATLGEVDKFGQKLLIQEVGGYAAPVIGNLKKPLPTTTEMSPS